jgi:OOP family OmpA-OmpF porin
MDHFPIRLSKGGLMMKKIILGAALILMLSMTASGYAQVKAGAYSVSPFIGGYTFEGNQDLDTGLAYGLRAGYYFTRNWGLEAYLHHVPTQNDSLPGNPSVDLLGYGVASQWFT